MLTESTMVFVEVRSSAMEILWYMFKKHSTLLRLVCCTTLFISTVEYLVNSCGGSWYSEGGWLTVIPWYYYHSGTFNDSYQRYYITITHMLLNLNRSSHVKARNVVILPCVQDDALTSDLYVTRETFHCLLNSDICRLEGELHRRLLLLQLFNQ